MHTAASVDSQLQLENTVFDLWLVESLDAKSWGDGWRTSCIFIEKYMRVSGLVQFKPMLLRVSCITWWKQVYGPSDVDKMQGLVALEQRSSSYYQVI